MATKGLNISAVNTRVPVKISEAEELANADIERLLFNGLNSSIGNLRKGSRVMEYFWEPNADETSIGIINEVELLFSLYEPRIVPVSITSEIVTISTDQEMLEVSFEYFMANDAEQNIKTAKFLKIKEYSG